MDTMESQASETLAPRVIAADEGKLVRLNALGVRYVARGAQTGGRFAVVEYQLDARRLGAPLHTHLREEEITFVAEGVVGVMIGDQVFTASRGATVIKPRGIPHTFWNAGDTPARALEIISPVEFEDYFEEVAEVLAAATNGAPDQARVAAIREKYALSVDLASVPVLMERHGLRG